MKEKLAELAHEQWSGWMKHLFDVSYELPDGNIVVPSWIARRWKQQMNTPYSELSESEKRSAREEADKMLVVISNNTHREYFDKTCGCPICKGAEL